MTGLPLFTIPAIGPVDGSPGIGAAGMAPLDPAGLRAPETRFADWLTQGVDTLSQRMGHANALATQFATGADIPPHQVVLALEDARLSFQLALQVRTRLLEGYQELMRMQL